MTPEDMLGPMLSSCKRALDENGQCLNMACFLKGDTPLVTALYSFNGDDAKQRMSGLLGGVGHALGADLVVCISDMYLTHTDAQGLADYLAGNAPRPSENPARTEALMAMIFTPLGADPMQRYYPYSRDDHGKIVWQPDGSLPDWVTAGGDIPEAWIHGLTTDTTASAKDLLTEAAQYGVLQCCVMDNDTQEALLG